MRIVLDEENSAKVQELVDLTGRSTPVIIDAILATPSANDLLAGLRDLYDQVKALPTPTVPKVKKVKVVMARKVEQPQLHRLASFKLSGGGK